MGSFPTHQTECLPWCGCAQEWLGTWEPRSRGCGWKGGEEERRLSPHAHFRCLRGQVLTVSQWRKCLNQQGALSKLKSLPRLVGFLSIGFQMHPTPRATVWGVWGGDLSDVLLLWVEEQSREGVGGCGELGSISYWDLPCSRKGSEAWPASLALAGPTPTLNPRHFLGKPHSPLLTLYVISFYSQWLLTAEVAHS